MIDLLTLTAALLLQPAAHNALDTGPQPRALRWEMNATFRPEADDEAVEFREKWSAEDQEWHNGTFLRPGRGITSTYWNASPLYLVPPSYPIYGLCCGYSDEDDPPQGYVPETPEPPAVPLSASLLFLLTGALAFTLARASRR